MSRQVVLMRLFLLLPLAATPSPRLVASEPKPVIRAQFVAAAVAPEAAHDKIAPAAEKPGVAPILHGGAKAISRALKEPTTIDVTDLPLRDVVSYLSFRHHIPIQIDPAGLMDAGIEFDVPITKKLSGISLRSALGLLLDELQLKWVIHHQVLFITSPQKAESDEFLVTKIYDVADILDQPADHPPVEPAAQSYAVRSSGMLGGSALSRSSTTPQPVLGMFPMCAEPALHSSSATTLQEIMDLIVTTVATTTWLDNGGTGTISPLGSKLVITNTQDVHREAAATLAKLRAAIRKSFTVSVDLHWLWLDARRRDALFPVKVDGKPGVPRGMTSQRLRQVAGETPHFHARLTCVNGVETVIASGDRRFIIGTAVPVVDGGMGHQPSISVFNIGVATQFRPTIAPDKNSAMLTIRSTIVRQSPESRQVLVRSAWPAEHIPSSDAPKPAMSGGATGASPTAAVPAPLPIVRMKDRPAGSGTYPIDLPVLPTQQLGTTIRVPLGKPVVVGSINFAPQGDAGLAAATADPLEVYLIATIRLVKVAK